MNTNGQANPPETQQSFPNSNPDWQVSDELARKAAVDRVTRFGPAERRKYEAEMMAALGASTSWRFVCTNRRTREKLAQCFVETMDENGDKEVFRAKLKNYGFSPMLIFFILGVAWDILFWVWKKRHETECKTY